MKRLTWLAAGLALSAALGADSARVGEGVNPRALGKGPAYEALAKLPVLHEGRRKPFDTLAREEVKQIFGRETVKLLDASKDNQVVETWTPVAALFDWSVRPEFWDEKPIILVEFLPLKRRILADSIKARFAEVSGKATTSTAVRETLAKLADDPELSSGALTSVVAKAGLPAEDAETLRTLAAELSEEHKWLTPSQLEEATIASEGRNVRFDAWFQQVVQKKRKAENSPTGEGALDEVERRGYEVGTRLVHYQALRDREMRSVEPLRLMPRPSDATYLAFLGKTSDKARKTQSVEGLTLFEIDGLAAVDKYWNELPQNERRDPGSDPEFDREFSAWLKGSSAWVPIKALLEAKAEGLSAAGYPSEKAAAFFSTFKALEDAEDAAPGAVPYDKAEAFVAASRALAESVNGSEYPTPAEVSRETFFNTYNPFFIAPWAYVCATAFLGACLGFLPMPRGSFLRGVGRVLYGLGVGGLVAGIALEVVGFYLRVRISGWAPVTNMYETVIWVALVSAVLGLVFEMVFRKVYAALAASGVALLGTFLAANVPLLDPGIRALQPVLRSNYWLLIHVLSVVSSYAAFLLAAGLGVIAAGYYLTATYRRSPGVLELAALTALGLPALAVGVVGVMACQGDFGTVLVKDPRALIAFWSLGWLGGVMTLAGLLAVGGELVARVTFREDVLDETDVHNQAGQGFAGQASLSTASAGGVGTATLTKPSVADIIRKAASEGAAKLDARGRAMQATAAQIKPLSNFIYRSMQVGVLLVAAGTILGGVWADYSWGRFWGWDPKEVWALITLLVYLVPLHGRFAGWFNTFALVAASVVCSMSVIMAWYGVNFVLGVGLHSYGFTEGGGQGVVMAACGAVLALPLAAGWRRARGSMRAVALDPVA